MEKINVCQFSIASEDFSLFRIDNEENDVWLHAFNNGKIFIDHLQS